jgi:glycosyltransferase involved in cell wall biosynthesis
MVRYIRREQPDIIHASGSQDHWTGALGNCLLRKPVCVVRTRHNTYAVSNNLPNQILNRRWTDFQIVVCDVVRKDLARQSAFDPDRMRSIHNGVDVGQFKPDPEKRKKARSEFGYNKEDLVLGIAARLVKDKGHEYLFRAAGQLYKMYPNMKILVLGQGVLEGELKQLVRDLGISDRVQFAGFKEDMAMYVQAFDIGVQPSIGCDTSSFSLKEQMAAELPVIASDYGGLKEIVYDGVEGLVVQTASVQPLAAAIRRMLDSEELRIKMGKAGHRRVLQDFTVEIFAERTLEAYRQALEIHRERAASR